jgi:hypothetical protein
VKTVFFCLFRKLQQAICQCSKTHNAVVEEGEVLRKRDGPTDDSGAGPPGRWHWLGCGFLSWSVLVGASHAFPKKDSAAAPLAARQARQARGRGDPLRRSIRALQHPHALPAVRCGLPRAAHTAHFCYAAPCSLARHHPDASADIYKHSQGLDGPGRLRAARRSFLGVPGSPFCSLALGREQQRGPASGFAARAV